MVLFPEIEVAGTELSLTVIERLLQIVVLHVPSALTKYVVEATGETVIDDPDPTALPPQDALYHLQVAPVPRLPPFTDKVVDCP
jgi:hypothetical protein